MAVSQSRAREELRDQLGEADVVGGGRGRGAVVRDDGRRERGVAVEARLVEWERERKRQRQRGHGCEWEWEQGGAVGGNRRARDDACCGRGRDGGYAGGHGVWQWERLADDAGPGAEGRCGRGGAGNGARTRLTRASMLDPRACGAGCRPPVIWTPPLEPALTYPALSRHLLKRAGTLDRHPASAQTRSDEGQDCLWPVQSDALPLRYNKPRRTN